MSTDCHRLGDLLRHAARAHPERNALWHEHHWHGYAALANRAERTARQFADACAVRPGDRVAILLENSPDHVVAVFGAFFAGAVEVSLATDVTAESLAWLLLDSGARVLVCGRRFAGMLPSALAGAPGLEHVVFDSLPRSEAMPTLPARVAIHELPPPATAAVDPVEVHADDEHALASLVYTSGSTGRPKGVMLSHANLLSNTRAIATYLALDANDRVLAVLPFHYSYGRSLLYTHLLVGGSVVIENRFAYPNVALDTLERTHATGFAGVPSTFSILLARSTLRTRRFPSLRYVTQAGGALAPGVLTEAAKAFAPARFFVMYGTTEASPRLTWLDPAMLQTKLGSIGKAVPGVEVFVAGPDGRRLERGQVGEIAARGPNIMLGYWGDPAGTAAVLRDGTFFTGDLGREDEDGFLFVEGRIKDIIKCGGNRVSAREIEEAIVANDGVLEAAVIGVPDPILGEAIKAFVVPKEGVRLDRTELERWLAVRLPPTKRPRWLELRADLPKNAAGKVLKAALRESERKTAAS
ncbi:MAG: acyl--CoA ligase [Planctomycetes bacterium]|nr:acyl--CoA ligase [Planctomycetota bacterium]